MADKDRERIIVSDEPNEEYDEELGAETAIDHRNLAMDHDDENRAVGGAGMGWLALVLSIVSFFVLPVIMGAAGIIVGIIARRQGARALGTWAIGLGIVAIVARLFFTPFF